MLIGVGSKQIVDILEIIQVLANMTKGTSTMSQHWLWELMSSTQPPTYAPYRISSPLELRELQKISDML